MLLFQKYFSIFKPYPRADNAQYINASTRIFIISIDLMLTAIILQTITFFLSFLIPSVPQELIEKYKFKMELLADEQAIVNRHIIHNIILGISCIIITSYYTIYMWHRFGGTFGTLLFKARIVDHKTLQYPATKQCIKRYFMSIISVLFVSLGLVWIIFSKKNQAWQDIFANTVMIKEETIKAAQQNISNKPIILSKDKDKYPGLLQEYKNLIKSFFSFYSDIIKKIKKKQ